MTIALFELARMTDDKAPNKPSYPPIWDREAWRKRHAAVVEEPTAPPKPAGPPPLPPASIFTEGARVLPMLPSLESFALANAPAIGAYLDEALARSRRAADEEALVLILDALQDKDDE